MHRTTTDIAAVAERVSQGGAHILSELRKVIIGQDEVVEQVLIALFTGGHCLITGVPGLAKTLLIKTVAQILDLSFKRIQFTPDLMPADITGTEVLDEQNGHRSLRFVKGPIFAQILLADEINRTPPKTQAALLEAMQESPVTAAGRTYPLEPPFFVLATQNPIELEGTYPLPEAQVDRFLAKLKMGYPAASDEKEMLRRYSASPDAARETRRVLEPGTILRLQELADAVHVEDELLDYVIALAQFTRTHRRVALGASPRAALQLVHAAKARALLGGRD